MKRLILLLLVFVLTSCAGLYSRRANLQIKSAAQKEQSAWALFDTRAMTECAHGKKPEELSRSQVVKVTKCNNDLVNQIVLPVAAHPDLVLKMRAEALRDAETFSKGKISMTEKQVRAQERWASYIAEWNSRAQSYFMQANQADVVQAQRMQAVGQSLMQFSSNLSSSPTTSGTPCMFNPATNANQQCFHVTAGGQCAHYGAPCR